MELDAIWAYKELPISSSGVFLIYDTIELYLAYGTLILGTIEAPYGILLWPLYPCAQTLGLAGASILHLLAQLCDVVDDINPA